MPNTRPSKKRKFNPFEVLESEYENCRIEEYADAEWRALCEFLAPSNDNDDYIDAQWQRWLAKEGNVVWSRPPAKKLQDAVRAAVQAYAKTGKMLDAALAYAAHGFPIFPLTTNKEPVPKRDRDAKGKKIPGTGSFKKATTDPKQIHKWWDRHEYLIGLPMGAATGTWCLDVDTSEDHADGVAEWERIVAQHSQIQQRRDKHSGQRYEVVVPPSASHLSRSNHC